MAPISMELKLISCKDLKSFNFFQKLSIYAIVSIVKEDPDKKQKKQHLQKKTPIDREGDGNPVWNHEMRFDLEEISSSLDQNQDQDRDHLFLEFDLRCEGIVFGNKTIGEVRVPFKDLIEESNGAIRYVSYQVRTTDGKPNGVLDFSYKVINNKIQEVIDNKIQKAEPAIENSSGFHVLYPSVENVSPPQKIYPPLTDVYYPLTEVNYPSSEVYYMAPPPNISYYPPPPPPPPVYPTPVGPYGYETGSYSYPVHPYYTGVELQQQADDDTWRRGLQQRGGGGGIAGFWNFR